MKRSTAVMLFVISQTIPSDGLPLEHRNRTPEDAFNHSISGPSSIATTAAAAAATATTSSSSSTSSSSKVPFLLSPDYMIRLRRNNRTSVFYAYFHSVVEEEEGAGTNLDSNHLPLRRESGDGVSLLNKKYDDKGIIQYMYMFAIQYNTTWLYC